MLSTQYIPVATVAPMSVRSFSYDHVEDDTAWAMRSAQERITDHSTAAQVFCRQPRLFALHSGHLVAIRVSKDGRKYDPSVDNTRMTADFGLHRLLSCFGSNPLPPHRLR